MKRLRSIIVDDEPNARNRLSRLLRLEDRVQMIGEAEDGLSALQAIQQHLPDLIFLDIQMPGLDGFGVLQALPRKLPLPLIIFTTGYHEHALRAFEANALAYLLKPIEPERLSEMVDRAWLLQNHSDDRQGESAQLHKLTDAIGRNFRQIVARKLDRFILLDPSAILYFYIDRGIVRVQTGSQTYWVNYQIGELEQGLVDRHFFRAHRSSLVNLEHVKEIKSNARSGFVLILDDAGKTEIEVSERQAKALRAAVPGL